MTKSAASIIFLASVAIILLVTLQTSPHQWWPSFPGLQDVNPDTHHYHLKHHQPDGVTFKLHLPETLPPAERQEVDKEVLNFQLHPALQLRHRRLRRKSSKGSSTCEGKGSKSSKSSKSSNCSSMAPAESPIMPATPDPTPVATPAPTDPAESRTLPPDDPSTSEPAALLLCRDSVPLPTGAVLSVELDLRNANGIQKTPTANEGQTGEEATLQAVNQGNRRELAEQQVGTATLTAGGTAKQFLHITYAPDYSDSTLSNCGKTDSNGTGLPDSVWDCIKQALLNVNDIVASSSVAVNVGLVTWSDNAERQQLGADSPFVPPNDPALANTLNNITPKGGTNLFRAIETSIISAKEANSSAITSWSIIVITDGKEGNDYNNVENDIKELQEAGITVYTFAVGGSSSCTETMKRLSNETGGGDCNFVANPADLQFEVQEVVVSERTLDSISVEVNGIRQPSIRTDPVIPTDGLTYNNTPVTVFADLQFKRRRELAPLSDVGLDQTTQTDQNDGAATQQVCLSSASRGDVASCCVNVAPTTA